MGTVGVVNWPIVRADWSSKPGVKECRVVGVVN